MPRRVALLLFPLLIAGCSGSQTTQEESAAGTADALIKTCAAGRPRDTLELLTPPARDFFASARGPGEGCRKLLKVTPHGARVVSVQANDLSATVEVEGADGTRSHLELEKSRGIWSVMHP